MKIRSDELAIHRNHATKHGNLVHVCHSIPAGYIVLLDVSKTRERLRDKERATVDEFARINPSAHQTISAFGIPVVLILVSAFTKKIVRGKSPIRVDDFYLGLDLTLAAFSLASVNVLELNPNGREQLAWYFVFTFIVYILQLSMHQQWAGPSVTSLKEFLLLGFASNGIGIALVGFFIYWKVEGKL